MEPTTTAPTEGNNAGLAGDGVPYIESPWEVHHEADVTGYPAFYIHGLSGNEKRDTATLDATARLIEAAPRLLRLLNAFYILHCRSGYPVTDADYWIMTQTSEAIHQAVRPQPAKP